MRLLPCLLLATLAAADPGDQVQLCGAELAQALDKFCTSNIDKTKTQHQHNHNHQEHTHDHQNHQNHQEHDQNHQTHHKNHQDHDNNHQEHDQDWKDHAMKRAVSLTEACCLKPCYIKDFHNYCP